MPMSDLQDIQKQVYSVFLAAFRRFSKNGGRQIAQNQRYTLDIQ